MKPRLAPALELNHWRLFLVEPRFQLGWRVTLTPRPGVDPAFFTQDGSAVSCCDR